MMATSQQLPDGSIFVAHSRHVPENPPFGDFGPESKNPSDIEAAEKKLSAWVSTKWNMLFELKRGETERLKLCENYYSGFHWDNAFDQRQNPVTNFCFSSVETVWPILTEVRPRPEPVPRRFMEADRIKRIADFATYKMDTSGFDKVFRICVRDLLKYGWCCPMLGWDSNGASVPRYLSPFDFYPDGATEESEMECFAIARPVSVRRLRALFPNCANEIHSDNIASPSYEVMVQPYLDSTGFGGRVSVPPIIGTMPSTIMEGDPTATTSGHYAIDTGSFQTFGQTAFLVQLFVRDYTTMKVRYQGDRHVENPQLGNFTVPHSVTNDEPCSPSGWRMIPMLANGKILQASRPVDPALGGIPLVIGRNYEQGGRFYPKGELDDIIPIQRALNRSDMLLDRALELQGNPPVVTTIGSGLSVDRASVDGGDIIRVKQGHKVEYMQPTNLAESHFERRAMRRNDIQIVGGTPDALQGQRPVGIEAGTAIRQLTESATTRAHAKSSALLEWSALLLEKMLKCDAMKSTDVIYYKGNDGRDGWMDPNDLNPDDFSIRWAQKSGNAQGEQDRQDLDLQLLQLGVIDAQTVLEDLEFPGRDQILARVGMQRMQEAAAAQQQANKNGGGNSK